MSFVNLSCTCISSWLREDRRGRADLFGTAGFVASHVTLLTSLKKLLFNLFLGLPTGTEFESNPPCDPTDDLTKICFSECLWGLPLGRESGSNLPCDLIDDPKKSAFQNVSGD